MWYLTWLALAAMLGVPYALRASRRGPAAYALLHPAGGPVPWLLQPLQWASRALYDMAGCPILWWPQVRRPGQPLCGCGRSRPDAGPDRRRWPVGSWALQLHLTCCARAALSS